MRFGKRLLSVLLIIACLASLTVFVPSASADTGASSSDSSSASQSYTKNKVVSVLYDTSASMRNFPSEYRYQYAQYAMQMLMSMLGAGDRLLVTPMHSNADESSWVKLTDTNYKSGNFKLTSSSTDYKGSGFEVDLSDPNRNAIVAKALSNTFLGKEPRGGDTPADSIEYAVQHLIDAGMKTHAETSADEESNTEYYLVVLTDGALNNKTEKETIAKTFKSVSGISSYASYQCIYLAFGAGAIGLDGTSLDSMANFASYTAKDSNGIISAMQSVANQISGRYALEKSAYTVSGSTVTVDLSKISFGLRSVSVMLQNCTAKLTGASYSGEALNISQPVTIAAGALPNMKNGSSAVIKRTNDAKFSDGTLTMQFDGAVDETGLAILLEPSLSLTPVLEYNDGTGYISVDPTYINSHLKGGDTVYVSYTITDEASGKAVTMSDATAQVSYNGSTAAISGTAGKAPIKLVNGSLNISLSVSVMNGEYTMYASVPCVVLENPHFFRIVAGEPEYIGGSIAQTQTVFTVYNDNRPIESNDALAAFTYSASLTSPTGEKRDVALSAQDGKLVATVDTSSGKLGMYTLTVTVRDSSGNPRTASADIAYYPNTIALAPVGESTLSMSLHALSGNETTQKGFSFALTADGEDFIFANGITSHRVTLGGTDVTAACTVDGNILTFIPTKDNLGAFGTVAGEGALTVTVSSAAAPHLSASTTATLRLTDTVLEVIPVDKSSGTVDRFSLKKNQSSLYFRVVRDGEYLSAEELAAALEDGTLSFDSSAFNALTPLSGEATVESIDGIPTVRLRFTSDQISLISFFTSMFVFGSEKNAVLVYQGAEGSAEGESAYMLKAPGVFPYLLRIAIILAIVYMIIFAVVTFKCVRFSKGTFVKMRLKPTGRNRGNAANLQLTHVGGFPRCLLFKRLIPIVGLRPMVQEMFLDGNRVDAEKRAMNIRQTPKKLLHVSTDGVSQDNMREIRKRVQDAYRSNQLSVSLPSAKALLYWEPESIDIETRDTAQFSSDSFIVLRESDTAISVIFYVPYRR